MGIKGFRVDAVKHMSDYQINAVFTPEIKQGMHVFGEVITTGGLAAPITSAFSNPTSTAAVRGPMTFRCLPPCVVRWGMAAA